jgi:hypothetical protein
MRRQGREDWLKLRAELAREATPPAPARNIEPTAEPEADRDKKRDRGIDDDYGL